MIIKNHGIVSIGIPSLTLNVSGIMSDITQIVINYCENAANVYYDALERAAEDSVFSLPGEWADEFMQSLDHSIERVGTSVVEFFMGSSYEEGDNYEYVRTMVMEAGSSNIHSGPMGRPVYRARMEGPREPSRAPYMIELPQLEHHGDGFFSNTIKKLEKQFLDGLREAVSYYVSTGAWEVHIISG